MRAYCASGEYGLLTKLTSPRGHSLAGNRGTGLPTVRTCGELRRVPLGLPLVGVRGWRRGSLRVPAAGWPGACVCVTVIGVCAA